MERLKQRLATARQALGTLEELREEPFSKIVRDAAIQRFEYTFEAVLESGATLSRDCRGCGSRVAEGSFPVVSRGGNPDCFANAASPGDDGRP